MPPFGYMIMIFLVISFLAALRLSALELEDNFSSSKDLAPFLNSRKDLSDNNVGSWKTKIGTSNVDEQRNAKSQHSKVHFSDRKKSNHRNLLENQSTNMNNFEHQQNAMRKPTSGSNVHPLLRKVSSASLSLVYLLLAWRAMGSYDNSAQFDLGLLRVICNISVFVVFVLDLIGFFISMLYPSKFKIQLKLILGCNTVREILELIYNIIMIIISTSVSKFNRDFYFGRMIASVYFLTLCLSTSKIRWIESKTSNTMF